MANYEKLERHMMDRGCPARASEEADVTVPVIVRARSDVREVELKCVGEPRITFNSDVTPGRPGAVSRFTVSQRLRVEIPIIFFAEADVGEGHVKYKNGERCEGEPERFEDCDCRERDQDKRKR